MAKKIFDAARSPRTAVSRHTHIYAIYVCVLSLIIIGNFANVFADLEPGAGTPPNINAGHTFGAPQLPGSALIIYNALGYHNRDGAIGGEFSQGAMETFRAALAQDANFIRHPTRNNHDLHIPAINPRLTRVNILNVTNGTGGIDRELRAKFYNASSRIDNFDFEPAIFDSLYDLGNPLSYWSQVYDLRFIDAGGQTAANVATITAGDVAYFTEHLRTGGTLFLQAEYDWFPSRNVGIANAIRTLTQDKNFNSGNITAGVTANAFNFSLAYEHFGRDFNNLAALQASHPMAWSNAGSYPVTGIAGHPLITRPSDGNAYLILWSPEHGIDPSVGNGRLIVSFDINAWGDYGHQSRITRTSFALIQNIYDLMDGSRQFRVHKRFDPEQINVNEEGVCIITVTNTGNYTIGNIRVEDDLDNCLQYINSSGSAVTPVTAPPAGTNGANLVWIIDELPARRSVEIRFTYRAVGLPPCQ